MTFIPSFLALDAPVNEEKYIFKLIENEQKSHSDLTMGYSLGIIMKNQRFLDAKH